MRHYHSVCLSFVLALLASCAAPDIPPPSSMAPPAPDVVYEYFLPEFTRHKKVFETMPYTKLLFCVNDFVDQTQRVQMNDGHGSGGFNPAEFSKAVIRFMRATGLNIASRTEIDRNRMSWDAKAGLLKRQSVSACDVYISGQFTNVTATKSRAGFLNLGGLGINWNKAKFIYTGDMIATTIDGTVLADATFNQPLIVDEKGLEVAGFAPTSISGIKAVLITGLFAKLVRESPDVAQRMIAAALSAEIVGKLTCITGWADKLHGIIKETCSDQAETPLSTLTLRVEGEVETTDVQSCTPGKQHRLVTFPIGSSFCCDESQIPVVQEMHLMLDEGWIVESTVGFTCPRTEATDFTPLRMQRAQRIVAILNAQEFAYSEDKRREPIPLSVARPAEVDEQRTFYRETLPNHTEIKDHGAAIVVLRCDPKAIQKGGMETKQLAKGILSTKKIP